MAEVFDCAAQWLHGARCVSTEGLAQAGDIETLLGLVGFLGPGKTF